METSELKGVALDWAVAKCEGYNSYSPNNHNYSTCWNKGGPIIEREKIATNFSVKRNCWFAENFMETDAESGTTLLEAAMRCFVASKLGDEVEIPNELTEEK